MPFIDTDERHLLRRLEQVTHVTTGLAGLLTIFLYWAGTARELNVVADALFWEFGFGVTIASALVVIAFIFSLYERVLDSHPRVILSAAALLAGIGVMDLTVNVALLAYTGVPGSFWWTGFALEMVLVAATTVLVTFRHRFRAELPSRPRLSIPVRSVGIVALSVVLTVAIAGPGIIMLPGVESDHSGTAAAGHTWEYTGESQDLSTETAGPTGMYQDANGDWWVVGYGGGETHVYKYDSSWSYTGTSYNLTSELSSYGSSVYKGSDGQWYVADVSSAMVHEYDSSWSYTGNAHDLSGDFSGLHSISQGENGYWYATVAGSDSVLEYDSNWQSTGGSFNISAEVTSQRGITQDSSGNWWVVDNDDDTVNGFNSDWSARGESYNVSNQAPEPRAVFQASGGNYWIAGESSDSAHEYGGHSDDSVSGDITGRVTDQNGDPVENATVYATGIETADPPQLDGRDYDELVENPLPSDWRDQLDAPGFSKKGINPGAAEFDGTRVLMHRSEQWNLEGWPWPQDGVVTVPNSELDPPQTVMAPGDEPTFSCWDFGASTREKLFEDNFGSSLPGAIIDLSCDTIVLERIDPMGDDHIEVTPTPEVRIQQGSAALSNGFTVDYEYAKPELSPGVYKVYSKGQADSPETHMVYTVAPQGDPSELEFNIENYLEDAQDAQTQAQKDLQEAYDAGNIELSKTTTNESGYYGLNMPSQVDRVDVVAVKGGPNAQGTKNLTRNDVRTDVRSSVISEFESTSARSWEDADREQQRKTCSVMDSVVDDVGTPYTGQRTGVSPPNENADIEGVRLLPDAVDEDVRYCYAVNLAEHILDDGLNGLFPGLQDDLSDLPRSELEGRYSDIMGYISGTPMLEDALDARTDGDIDTVLEQDPSELSRDELEGRVGDGVDVVDSGGDTGYGGGSPSGGDAPTVGTPDPEVGDETLSALWPVGNVNDWSDASLLVRLHYSNGSTTMLNGSSEYVTVDENTLGADTVRLEEYPLGETDPATVQVDLDVSTPDGSNGAPDDGSGVVRNPTFDGEVPAIRDLQVSHFAPGPSDNVSVGVTPADSAKFGQLKHANVSHADCSYSTTAKDDEIDLKMCGSGVHHIQVTFTNPGGVEFVETVRLDAKAAAQTRPASIRSKVGPVGRYAVVNGQLAGGDIQTRNGASTVEVIAIAEPDNVPGSLIASTTGMDVATDSDTVVRVVEGDAQQTVRKRVGVLLHRDAPKEGALLYRNGDPIPQSGETPAARLNTTNGKLTMDSFTTERGEVTLRVNEDPSLVDRIRHWAALRIPFNVPLLSIAGSDTVLLIVPLLVYRRRQKRPPNTGNGGNQEVAA